MRWKPWLVLLSALILSAAVFAFFANTAFRTREPEAAAPEEIPTMPAESPLVTFIDPARGPADAPVEIVMYGDYVCPFCREAEKDIARITAEYPSRMRFVWKDLPNPIHLNADVAAEAGHCAKAQGKFWEYHDLLIAESTSFNQSTLTLAANTLGLDLDKFSTCLTGREMRPLIERTVAEARALGIEATPYFFINGERFEGQPSYEQLIERVRP